MIVLISILAATRASPVAQSTPPLDQFQARAPFCDELSGHRSLWDIIWSCAVTILLCTWVSVHPNIPSPHESWARVAWRRVGLMLATLFVPEAMIAWALRQRLAAVELANILKGEGWTTTHGFFAIMGGFMEYEGNRPIRVLLPEELNSYSLTGNGDFPRIAKEEIEDKSKGEGISKILVVLQTGWFVTQCIARGVQGLPVTELELITVAFATLNFVMYLLWWDKPLNVQCGVRVYKKRNTEQPMDDGDIAVSNPVGFWGALRDALSDLRAAIVRGPLTGELDNMPWLIRVLLWPIWKPMYIVVGEEEKFRMRVNTFYPGEWVTGKFPFIMFTVVTVTLVFGGIHCIGWSFTFPSSAEKTLWRVASVTITVFPLLFMPVSFLDGYFFIILPHVMLLLYLFCRLVLLVIPFVFLRSLPLAAYHVVPWVSSIPHV
ncbi:hypothetical protein F5148DRAFT_978758 [Russula earlei]|uniref:Uncharacterized protein n=1 Tax=Russula earlei TaxID=71964 RepID=A0ACC0UBQ7_9AGAM|nr:hypothetical protein F5148DRAFT_978758 [Russula earlei]